METLWLGYDGLAAPLGEIVAVLRYQPALNQSIVRAYGSVPPGVQSVVVTAGGRYLPARQGPEQLRRRWARWRSGQGEGDDDDHHQGDDGDDGLTR